MQDVRKLSDAELVDMLSLQTAKLTSLLAGRTANPEYQRCKLLIQALSVEIESRRSPDKNQTITDTGIFFDPE